MLVKIILLLLFFGCMVAVGLYSRKSASNTTDFVLGGRSVGPWLSAFAYGTSYFSAVVFVGYAGQFGWKYGLASTWIGIGNAVLGSLIAWVVMGRRTRVMTLLGGFGRLFDAEAIYNADGSVMYDAIIPQMLSTLPDILIGVVIVLVLSASMSTLSSLVLTSASTLTLDFIKGNIVKEMDDKKQLIYIRVLIVFFIVISVVLALNPPTFIAQLMGISWGALAGAFPWLFRKIRESTGGIFNYMPCFCH